MAERRMLSSKIICSDAFTDMPFSAQALYLQLNMEADDDGFLNNAKRIQRTILASDDDLQLLLDKRFLLSLPNGVVVIKHWRMHNQIRKDRHNPTQYQDAFDSLEIRNDGAYTEKIKDGDSLATTWQPNDNQDGDSLATQVRLGKDRLGKESVEEAVKPPRTRFTPPTVEEVQAYCTERKNNVDPERFVDYYASKGWLVGKAKMKDWKAAVRNWERKEDKTDGQTTGNIPKVKYGEWV